MVQGIATVFHFKRNATVSVPTLILVVNSRDFVFAGTVFIRPPSTLKAVIVCAPRNLSNASSGYLCLNSVTTATLFAVPLLPVFELRQSIFLGLHSPCEDAELPQEDLHLR